MCLASLMPVARARQKKGLSEALPAAHCETRRH